MTVGVVEEFPIAPACSNTSSQCRGVNHRRAHVRRAPYHGIVADHDTSLTPDPAAPGGSSLPKLASVLEQHRVMMDALAKQALTLPKLPTTAETYSFDCAVRK